MNKFIVKFAATAAAVSLGAIICESAFNAAPKPKTLSVTSEFSTVTNSLKSANPKHDDCIRILSYNLFADSFGFEGTNAVDRADGVCNMINTLAPDVIGLQETSRNWHTCIREKTDYSFIFPLRTEILGTMTCIIYNNSTVTLLASGEEVFKSGGDTRLRRMVWGLFKQKSNSAVFAVINTHFSLSSADTKVPMKQARELLSFGENLYEKYRCPVFFTGDFNARERNGGSNISSALYETLCSVLDDSKTNSPRITSGEKQGIYASSNDHIFFKGEAVIKNYAILSQKEFEGLSDHYPIFVDIFL